MEAATHYTGISQEYAEALEASRKATDIFIVVRNAYRARTIGDDEYLKARKIHEESLAAFDLAYAKESAQ